MLKTINISWKWKFNAKLRNKYTDGNIVKVSDTLIDNILVQFNGLYGVVNIKLNWIYCGWVSDETSSVLIDLIFKCAQLCILIFETHMVNVFHKK
jgi:hypothetical protein